MNPWKLTPAEERTMRQMIKHGGAREVALAEAMSPDTIHEHLANIKDKMRRAETAEAMFLKRGFVFGMNRSENPRRAPTAQQCVTMFDRWERINAAVKAAQMGKP